MRIEIGRIISFVLAGALLFCGRAYAEEENQVNQKNNFVEKQMAGIVLHLTESTIVIKSVVPEFPAEKAGIKAGDVVQTVDGRSFDSVKDLVDHISAKGKDGKVVFVVQRNGETRTFDFKTRTVKLRPTLLKLTSLLADKNKVVLAVVVSDVKNVSDLKREVYDSWAAGIRNEEQADMENFYIKNLGRDTNFILVDRIRTQSILDEFRLSQTGLLSDTMMLQIGKMTGATHLLDVNVSRFKNPAGGFNDVHSARLINIGSSAVMAVDQFRIIHPNKKK